MAAQTRVSGEGSAWARRTSLTLFGTVVFLSLYQALCHAEAFVDDAAISFSFARQLAQHGQAVHTASSEPVEGFSNPTWTFIHIVPFWLGMDPFIFARALGLLSLGATLWLVFVAARSFSPRGATVPVAATALVGLAPCVCFWAVPGLETPLVGLLLAALVVQLLRETDPHQRPWSGLLLAALALSRPEGVIYAGPAWLFQGLQLRRASDHSRRLLARRALLHLVWFGAPVVAYLVWRQISFSDWLPNTYYAKLGPASDAQTGGFGLESRGALYISAFFSRYSLWPLVGAVPLAFGAHRRRPEAVLLTSLAAVHLGFIFRANGDWMGDFRFFAMALPIYGLLLALVVQGAADQAARLAERLRGPARAAWWGRRTADALAVFFFMGSLLPTLTHYQRAGWVSMELVRQQGTSLELLARRSGLLRADAALPDVGASALFTHLNILDTVGLVDRVVARAKNRPDVMRRYFLEERRPDFYQAHSHWRKYYNLPLHPEFRRDYLRLPDQLTRRLVLLGDNYMRREHFTGWRGEQDHHLVRPLDATWRLQGYDRPLKAADSTVVRVYAEYLKSEATTGEQLSLEVQPASERPVPPVALDELSPDLLVQGAVLRLRFVVPGPAPVRAIRVRTRSGGDSGWLSAEPQVAARPRGADLERFLVYPRSSFVCSGAPERWQPDLAARGSAQLFDNCQPVSPSAEIERQSRELRLRAARAEKLGLWRTALWLLQRAELLQPESFLLSAELQRTARGALEEARRLAATGQQEAALQLLVEALRSWPQLAAARTLYLALSGQGLPYFSDRREQSDLAADRFRARPSGATQRAMLAAFHNADRPLEGLRLVDEIPLEPMSPGAAEVEARLALSLGLCQRAWERLTSLTGRGDCDRQWLAFRAAWLCGQATSEPSCPPPPLAAPEQQSLFEFENPELPGWELTRGAVQTVAPGQGLVSGFSGEGLLSTALGQRPTGEGVCELRSPLFRLAQTGLSLQIAGGGESDGVVVRLLVQGREVRRTSGQRTLHLERHSWDVCPWIGQEAQLQISDHGTGPWGFVLVDHVRVHSKEDFSDR